MKRALVLCPGRGSYDRASLGSLGGRTSHAVDVFDQWRSSHDRPTVREMDGQDRYSARLHVAGENASALTAALSLADLETLGEQVQVVAVCGNSLGWYTALGYAGVLSVPDCARLIDTMGSYQAGNVVGGQVIYPLIDDDWRADPTLVERVRAQVERIEGAWWSIRLGGQAVLGGTDEALAQLAQALPPIERGSHTFPLRLPLHSAFHTPLMEPARLRAAVEFDDLTWRAPRWPLIDGTGYTWRPLHTDTTRLRDWTLGDQITRTFDLTASLRTGLLEYAPDVVILPGPGSSLGGAIAQIMIEIGWKGIHDRQTFTDRQGDDPVLLAMTWPNQRALVT